MLIGAHVSSAGGLDKAVERAEALGCESMQIFNQSPRMWRPSHYGQDEYTAFRERIARSSVRSVVIHAVYLINCASRDREIRKKSIAALTQALRAGAGIGAAGVVLHPGSTGGENLSESMERLAKALVRSLAASEECPVLLENTAGAGGTIGRNFDELARLVELLAKVDGELSDRVGVCLDSCHLFASGIDITTVDAMAKTIDSFDESVGLERLKCLHLNDSKAPFGSNRDRHENLGDGEIGHKGLVAFLSDSRLSGLPVILEVPGPMKKGPDVGQIEIAKRLLKEAYSTRS